MANTKILGLMPTQRDFGWPLKTPKSSHFKIMRRDNGQFMVMLNHALVRGVSTEMLTWWFQTFTQLRVTLDTVPGYEGQIVPAYLLWHPSDHFNAELKGETVPDGAPTLGSTRLHIQEAMQYPSYGWNIPSTQSCRWGLCGRRWCAMGRVPPFFGPAMTLRIHFRGLVQAGTRYHYEIAMGVHGNDPVSWFINRRITQSFVSQFFGAW